MAESPGSLSEDAPAARGASRARSTPPARGLSRAALAVMVVVLLLAAAPRFYRLGAQSFWNDEGNAYVQSTRSPAEIAAHAARDIHPPGYYWALAGWRALVGESELALRALSALASLGTVAFTFALGRRLFAAGPAALAALLVALNSFSIYYAQEARMYALLGLWAAAGMWVFVGFTRRPRWREALALGVLNALGLWTQYAYAFVMLAQGVLLLVWVARGWRLGDRRAWPALLRFAAAGALSGLLFLPWLPTALAQIRSWPSAGAPVPAAEALNVVLGWLVYGVAYAYTGAGSFAIANFLFLFGLLPARGGRRAAWALLVPPLWVLATLAVFFAFQLFRPQNLKLLLPAQLAAALWLARGVWVLWTRWGRPAAEGLDARQAVFRLAAVAGAGYLGFNLAQAIPPLYADPRYQRADYRAIVAEIERGLGADGGIVLDAPNQEEVFRYYYRGGAPVYALPAGLGGDDAATRDAVRQLLAAHDRVFAIFWGETERDPNRVVETALDAGAFEVEDRWYGDVRLARYEAPAEPEAWTEAGVRFGDHITLNRYALSADTLAPGDVLQVALEWAADAPLDRRFKVFVQLLDDQGTLVAQRDSEPGGGLALTTTWQPGRPVEDRHGLLLPYDLTPAHYTLITGLYDLNHPEARLPVELSDYYVLRAIRVEQAQGA